jgi:hypothetical protein
VLYELSGAAALSTSMVSTSMMTTSMMANGTNVAHWAAVFSHVACLRVLHECFRASLEPIGAGRRGIPSDTASAMVQELEDRMALAYHSSRTDGAATPAAIIFDTSDRTTELSARLECYRYLAEIGGTAKLLAWLSSNPSMLAARFAPLLTEPGLLDLKTKQAWLVWMLKAVVGSANATQLMLVANRGNLLDGLCAQLGVDERTGRLTTDGDGALARGIDVRRPNAITYTAVCLYDCVLLLLRSYVCDAALTSRLCLAVRRFGLRVRVRGATGCGASGLGSS